MSFLSSSCQTCKSRKIKCDEAHPICSRCKKSGRTCLRRLEERSPLSIHIENSFASGRIKRPRGPRSSLKEAAFSIPGVIQRPLTVDLPTRALAYYTHIQLLTPLDLEGITSTLDDYVLAGWKNDRPQGPIVELAISSMALAVFSRTQHYPPAYIEAGLRYQQLLKAVRGTFSALSEANIDDCLLSTFFMSRYEDSFQHTGQLHLGTLMPHGHINPHRDGSMALLKYWRDHLYDKHPATNTIKQIRRGLLRFAARDDLDLPEWMKHGEVFGECGLELEYDRIIIRLTNLRRRLHTLVREAHVQPHEREDIVQQLSVEAQDIDKLLQGWSSSFPDAWNYQQHVAEEFDRYLRRHFYSSTIYVCSSPSYAAVWVKYFATRMLSIHTRLQVLDVIAADSDDHTYYQRIELLSDLERAARSLAYTVPSCLALVSIIGVCHQDPVMTVVGQEVKPHLARRLSWNLCLASSLEYVDAPLRQWFLAELHYLGKLTGIKVFEQADLRQ